MFHTQRFTDKGAGVSYAHQGGISDETLLAIASAYRSGVSRKMRTLQARKLGEATAAGEFFGSVKYDGEGVFVIFDAEKDICAAFNAPSGRCRIGLPCLTKTAEILKARGHKRALLVAELHLEAPERTRVGDVIRVMASGSAEDRERLALGFHDIIMLDGQDLRGNLTDYPKNWSILGAIFGEAKSERAHRVAGKRLGPGESQAFYDQVVGAGAEGIVLRSAQSDLIQKVKPSLTVDAVIIGMVEGEFEGRYGVTSLLGAVCAPDGKTWQVAGRVGSGFADNAREELLEQLGGLKVAAPINMTDSDGRPITFLKPSLVMEMEGEALIDQYGSGERPRSQTIAWDGENYAYTGLRECPLLSHAVFSRLRTDKKPNAEDCRAAQIMGASAIEAMGRPVETNEAAEPVVKIRRTWRKSAKEGREKDALRKLLVLERPTSDRFAPYTILWTDFSPDRAEPLKTEVSIARNETRLAQIVAEYEAEGAKRGWVETSGPTATGEKENPEAAPVVEAKIDKASPKKEKEETLGKEKAGKTAKSTKKKPAKQTEP